MRREGEGRACRPMTDVEQRFDDARSMRDLTSSTVLQGFNSSSLGELLLHESLVLHMVRRQKRLVKEWRMKVVSERKLAVLRLLGRKNVNKRLPSALRNAEGHPMEDQSCWESLIHEHCGRKFRRENVQKPETTRVFWKMKVWEALQRGHFPEELSFRIPGSFEVGQAQCRYGSRQRAGNDSSLLAGARPDPVVLYDR